MENKLDIRNILNIRCWKHFYMPSKIYLTSLYYNNSQALKFENFNLSNISTGKYFPQKESFTTSWACRNYIDSIESSFCYCHYKS